MKSKAFGKKIVLSLIAPPTMLFCLSGASAAPILNPDNGHYYEAVYTDGISWEEANANAQTRSFMGMFGHLATITSETEQAFLFSNFPVILDEHLWLGGFQPADSPEPAGGWSWITGESFTYVNWGSGEPNNAGDENALEFRSDGSWNDIASDNTLFNGGYLVEYDEFSSPVPIPPAALLLGSGLLGLIGVARRKTA